MCIFTVDGFRAWFDDDSDDVIIRQISRRVSDVTGLNTTQPAAEPLQVGSHRTVNDSRGQTTL